MLIEKKDITTLLPQRPPILMVDELLSQTELITVTRFKVEADNLFIRHGEMQEGGLIENIAQSAAARAGYYYQQQNVTPPLGFIGAISKVKINRYPKVGEVLHTTIEMKSEVFNITLVKGTSCINDEQIAECEMKIVIDDPNKK